MRSNEYLRRPLALLALLLPLSSFGACSDAISGRSDKMAITISDGGCLYDVEHIIFWTLKPDGSPSGGEEKHFPFHEECAKTKRGFACKAGGRTPLAGTSYRLEKSGTDPCDDTGKTPVDIYRCVNGCSRKSVPEFLLITPYEC